MKLFRLILAALAALWAAPLLATPTPTFTISSPTAPAGQPEVFTITRAAGAPSNGAYVRFETKDGTAHAGVDYTAVQRLIYVKSGVQSVTVSVPTALNPAAIGNLTFLGVIASTNTPANGTATMIEPAAPPPPSSWVTAPLTVGGYACNATQLGDPKTPPCGQGTVYRIVGTITDGPGVLYLTVFYADASKQFPLNDDWATSFIAQWAPDQLQGLAPAQ